jgi:YaaC-like protein
MCQLAWHSPLMFLNRATALRELRWTRSTPPGMAAGDSERRSIYVAALQQFEELFGAAERLGPAAKPLPLFYALSQAGRAIVAAHGDSPRTLGHGLGEVVEDDEADAPVLHRRVRRRASDRDTFGAVARATHSGDFSGSIEIGAAWVANPGAPRISLKRWRDNWRLALDVISEDAADPVADQRGLWAFPFADPPEATVNHGHEVEATRYPTLPPTAVTTVEERKSGESFRTWRATVRWPTRDASIDDVAPRVNGDRCLLPMLVGQAQLLSPLMLWWVVLFGFSIYARYNPELWVKSLDVNSDVDAVGIERMLDAALDYLPALVYEAATGDFYPVPATVRTSGPPGTGFQ